MQYAIQFLPGSTLRFFKTFRTPLIPSLKLITAEATPISNVVRPTKMSFGHRFQMTPFMDSLLFWVYPCKHFFKRLSLLKSIKTGLMVSLIIAGRPGLYLYKLVLFTLSV